MKNTRVALLMALLTAMVFVAGQALAGVPNVELVTFLSFVSGYLLGPLFGGIVGACGMAAHSLFNVMGAVVAPVWVAQIICYALVGAAGGVIGPAIARARTRVVAPIAAGLSGAGLTVVYQIVVNAVSYYAFASDVSVWVFIWGGIAFGAVQIAWNAALFFTVVPPTVRVLARYRREIALTR